MKKMKKLLMTLVLLLGGIFTTFAQSGYRGFADVSLGCSVSSVAGLSASFSTTHGYQFNGHIFLGAGLQIGYEGAGDNDNHGTNRAGVCLPIFLQLRYDYSLVSKHSFYGAIRAGFNTLSDSTFPYIAPEFGVRFGKNGPISFNIGFKLGLDGYTYYDTYDGWDCDEMFFAPTIVLGIEF